MEVLERIAEVDSQLDDTLHPVLRRVYATRGIVRHEELNLELAGLLPPDQLKNCREAAQALFESMQDEQHVLVVGDFDADGATSCALFIYCMKAMGYGKVSFLVPNRFEYGYGLTPEIVEVARQQNPDLIVTVDNGIASHEGVLAAARAGIRVLVTDHHLPGDTLPEAACILNPNQPGCPFPSKALAGVGVVFYLMSALRSCLREADWFERQAIPVPNLAGFLDLVALGTVADVVPLDQNNRRLVKHGLGIIKSGRGRPGIRALLEVAGRNPASVVASDLAFAAGPRLNAAGRLDDMSLGIACLLEDDPGKARQMAIRLDVLSHLDVSDADLLGICLYEAGWHQGVIGILASRIKERYHRPSIVFADAGVDEKGEAIIKGSARSIEGIHIRDVLDALATRYPTLLQKFGGHAMAAGLSIRQADFAAFAAAFEEILGSAVDPEDLQKVTWVDGELTPECFSLDFASLLREGGPWGQHFPEPLFTGNFEVLSSRVVGEKHLKLTLQPSGSQALIDAIAFNVEPALLQARLNDVELAYRLDVNEFRGQVNPQLMVDQILAYR